MKSQMVFSILLLMGSMTGAAPSLPGPPTDPANPGSEIYTYTFQTQQLTCDDREVDVFVPQGHPGESFPVVVYGHGQALGLDVYQATLEHLAKKGIIAVFPAYDNGFFDQDWTRMGNDYVNLTACALKQLGGIALTDEVVFAGHSKGAYVAGVAAGVAFQNKLALLPKAVLLFEPAGVDTASLSHLDRGTSLTVTFSDQDTVVKEEISASIYSNAPSDHKQFISVKSYTQTQEQVNADHFWPLTQSSAFGGGPVSALHYYGEWKWLGAAALDLKAGGKMNNPYLYGALATDKGLPGFNDGIQRNFGATALKADDQACKK